MDRRLFCCVALMLVVVNRAAAQARQPADNPSKPLDKWIDLLKDERLSVKARQALGPTGPHAKLAVPVIIDAFKKLPSSAVACQTLADYGPAVVPELLKAIARPEAKVRAGAAEALGYIRPRSVKLVPPLIEALKDASPEVRTGAARSLGRIGRVASQAAPSLMVALKDGHAEVRQAAARALSMMPGEAKEALGGLIPLLKDKNEGVCDAAALALQGIGPEAKAAVPALIEALRDKNYAGSSEEITAALAAIGPAAKQAVPALVASIKDVSRGPSFNSALALGHIGPDAKAAVPTLIKVLKAAKSDDHNSYYPDAVIFALGKIGPDSKAAVPLLVQIRALDGIRPEIGYVIADALWRIDPKLAAKMNLGGDPPIGIRLRKIPALKLAPGPTLTQERKKHIRSLIATLADSSNPDFGLSASATGQAFAPLPGQEKLNTFLLGEDRLETSDVFRALVALGAEALPFLLDALEDGTPTRLTVTRHNLMGLGGYIREENPLNQRESQVLSKPWPLEIDPADLQADLYTVKVGDVCFVAIGQIVGRRYLAVRYIPTAIIAITSPLESDEVRKRVREIWSSKDPARRLLDSLLIDYATEANADGKSPGWYDESDLQIAAAMRLLYYFPKESGPLIATRLRSFDLSDKVEGRDVKNGVRTVDFIRAVAWSRAPGIQEALAAIAKRTDDETIREALAPAK